MRKNIKTYIYVVTAILPIVLSACSNKTDNNMPKSTKESTTTTFVEDTSSGITSTIEETTTEEDTTKLISVTEHEVINSTENITEQQQTQANIQQTTTVTSVNSTPVPVQTTPRLTDTTIPTPEIRTTPSFIPIPSETTTPTNKLDETIKQPMPSLIVNGVTKGEKYSYNDIEFTVDSVKTSFHSVSDGQYSSSIHVEHKIKKIIYTISFEHNLDLKRVPVCYLQDGKSVHCIEDDNLLYKKYNFEIKNPQKNSNIVVEWKFNNINLEEDE